MKNIVVNLFIAMLLSPVFLFGGTKGEPKKRKTVVSIVGEKFFINSKPTFQGREWKGYKIEGLLPNSRMVQGIFDDENPETVKNWFYPDTKKWDADRNTQEFIDNMPVWKAYGLLSFTINLQGGSPYGYSNKQPWINSAIDKNGNLKPQFMARLERILDRADELGMVVMLGVYYFGQDENIKDENAIKLGIKNTVEWVLNKQYTNVMLEVCNESNDELYDFEILRMKRVHELISFAKSITLNNQRMLVSTSFAGKVMPTDSVIAVADYILLHGNGVAPPCKVTEFVNSVRSAKTYKPKPIVFNEDDHFEFEKPWNNFVAATSAYASWGYFDFRKPNDDFSVGFQSVPVDWSINSPRKKGFFNLLKEISGE